VNRFANAEEKLVLELNQTKDPLSKLPEIKVLEPYFEASSFESVRRLVNLDKQAKACLVLTGDPLKSKQRATFSKDFLSSGGFEVVQTDSDVQLIDQLHSENIMTADLIVLCSSDEEYEAILEIVNSENRLQKPLWIAGNPLNTVHLRKLGADDFIYLGCDAIKVFYGFLEALDE
jgi:methylmalonyl-CoA mutase